MTSPGPDVRSEIERIADAIRLLQSGGMPPEEFRRVRVVQGIYPVRGGTDHYLLRVRIPMGRPTPENLEILAAVAERYAQGRPVHLTTRQDVQIYGLHVREIPGALASLAAGGMTTREACGDTVRNIVICPFAGIGRDEIFDIAPIAQALGSQLLRNPLGQQLPRKFKIAFEGCAFGDHVGLRYNDVGARAARSPAGAPGFRVSLAGGLGALPRAGFDLEPFTPFGRLVPTVEAALRLFHRLGDRDRRGRARLKFVAGTMGEAAFREAILSERDRVEAEKGRSLAFPGPPAIRDIGVEEEIPESGWPGTVPQRQAGRAALPARIPLGDLSPDQLRRLARLAEDTGGTVRFTPSQGILLADLPFDHAAEGAKGLRAIGLFPPSCAGVARCAGADTCTIGTTRVRGLAAWIERDLFSSGFAESSAGPVVSIGISGCANGCGHHLVSDIGLQGVSRTVAGISTGGADRGAPHYMLCLGGGTWNDGTIRFGTKVGRVPVRRVSEAVRRVVARIRSGAVDGETPGGTISRLGASSFQVVLEGLLEPSPESFGEEDFTDLGSDGPVSFPPDRSGPKAP